MALRQNCSDRGNADPRDKAEDDEGAEIERPAHQARLKERADENLAEGQAEEAGGDH